MRGTEQGFTLIDLMVTLAVAAILTFIAVPSFKHFIDVARVKSAANSLVSAFQGAEVYASRHDAHVTVCASGDGSTCRADGNFSQGWLIRDASGAILRTWPAPKVSATNTGVKTATYEPNGFRRDVSNTGEVLFRDGSVSRLVCVEVVRVYVVSPPSTCND